MDGSVFLATIFANCNGVPVTSSAEEGFQSRRWKSGNAAPVGKAYYCISTVKDTPRARVLQRRTEDLVETRAVVLDDIGTKIPLSVAKKFPLPSYKLETSPGNFQWGYIFKAGEDPARVAALIEALANAGYTDKGSKRADRIMRIPGSLNDKYGEPFHARLVEWEPDRRWTLSELAVAFGVVPSDTPALPVGAPVGLEPGEVDPKFEWALSHDMILGPANPRGWYPMRCPKEHEHTGEIDHGTDYLPGKPGIFKCMHSHGDQLTTAWFTKWILEQDPSADVGVVPREKLIDVGNRLGAALGLLSTAPDSSQTSGNVKGGVPNESDLSRLQAALQEQAAAGSIFAKPKVDMASLSPATALAAIISETILDPALLPDYDTVPRGDPARHQATTDARVHRVMDLIGMHARWNVLTAAVEATFDAAPGYDPLNDKTDAAAATLAHACVRCGMTNSNGVRDALLNRALAAPYSPVCDWLMSREWDGISRLGAVYDTLTMDAPGEAAERWKRTAVRRWLLQGIAAMWNWQRDALAVDVGYVLVLQGDTGIGKSKWIERLLPAPWVSIGKSLKLDSPNERDIVSRVTGTVITEIGELDGSFRKSDDAALKNFLTTTIDTYRPPYGKRDVSRPRGTMFAASINPETFLKDPTGERRFWPLAVKAVDFAALERLDRQQLWAEVKALSDAGERYWLEGDEINLHSLHAREHRVETDVGMAVADIKTRALGSPDKEQWQLYGADEIAKNYGLKNLPSVFTDLGTLLGRAGFEKHRTKFKRTWKLPSLSAPLTAQQRAGFQTILGGKKDPE